MRPRTRSWTHLTGTFGASENREDPPCFLKPPSTPTTASRTGRERCYQAIKHASSARRWRRRTRTVYARQVRRFLAWLVAQPGRSGALDDAAVRDWAVRDWRRELATVDRLAPSTVNASLAAVDDLYEHLGLGPARRVPRDRPTMAAPRALDEGQR